MDQGQQRSTARQGQQKAIRGLESKLSHTVPGSQVDAVRTKSQAESTELKNKIQELEAKLLESVLRTELDNAKAEAEAKIQELQTNLSESKSALKALSSKGSELESRLAQIEGELEAAGRASQPPP